MRLIFALIALSACVRSNEVTCADGRICPPGNTCDDANHRCTSPEQLAACNALGDGDACTFAGIPGVCHGGACDPLLCGDGVRTGTEACDGNDLGGADCTTAGFYDPAGLACTQFCTFDTSQCNGRCGDGMIDGPELCDGAPPDGTCVDNGFDAGPLGCSGSCGASFTDCARFGWVAEPIALAQSNALSGTGPTDLWAVGELGKALHFDGGAWTLFPTGLTVPVTGVWAIATNDVWAVGGSGVVHWDGAQWTVVTGVPSPSYADVWAASSNAVFIATTTAGVITWNGATWQTLGSYTGGAISQIRGTSASDIWVADPTTLWHWDGASWHASLTADISGISAVAPDDIWVAGSVGALFNSLIAHYNGTSWTQYTATDAGLYAGITATAPNDAWVSGGSGMYHFDGTALTSTGPVAPPTRQAPGPLINFGPGSAFGLSGDGVAYRYHGQAYVNFDPQTAVTGRELWMDAGNDVFIGDNQGHIEHYDGATWTGDTTVVDASLIALFGTGPDNVWAGGNAGKVYRFNAALDKWSLVMTENVGLTGIWGTGPTDMWVSSGGSAAHYNGATWQDYPAASFSKFSGTGSSDIWGIAGGTLWHWDGASWQPDATCPSSLLVGVVAIASNLVVVADASYAYTWDGTTWTTQLLPIVNGAVAIAGTAADNIVVASASELAHFDGSRWSPVRMPTDTGSTDAGTVDLVTTPNMFAMLINPTPFPTVVRALLRTRPWVCEAKETECTNGVDDDCDGKIDGLDTDCQ